MKNELELKLTNRFKFYRVNLPETESLMCFGFECGDGWFDLIWELSEELEKLDQERINHLHDNDKAKMLLENISYEFNVIQVKEKFGELRFYADNTNNEMDLLIDKYTTKAESICIMCGKAGKMRTDNHWYIVQCDECYNKKE